MLRNVKITELNQSLSSFPHDFLLLFDISIHDVINRQSFLLIFRFRTAVWFLSPTLIHHWKNIIKWFASQTTLRSFLADRPLPLHFDIINLIYHMFLFIFLTLPCLIVHATWIRTKRNVNPTLIKTSHCFVDTGWPILTSTLGGSFF